VHVDKLALVGVWKFSPVIREDPRGAFLESFTSASFEESTGQRFNLRQSNISVSRLGTVRGIHFAQVPPGQAKYVQCVRGAIMDVVVDVRVGSPTFGRWEAVRLDDQKREALFVSEGLGHAFCALSPEVTVNYLCSEPYAPIREFGIHPLDPALGIPWPKDVEVVLSDKDAAAPTLAEAKTQGLLPTYEDCEEWYSSLRIT
jgi:dTDP-4-dehydrorhamnose 3,5-epimerase